MADKISSALRAARRYAEGGVTLPEPVGESFDPDQDYSYTADGRKIPRIIVTGKRPENKPVDYRMFGDPNGDPSTADKWYAPNGDHGVGSSGYLEAINPYNSDESYASQARRFFTNKEAPKAERDDGMYGGDKAEFRPRHESYTQQLAGAMLGNSPGMYRQKLVGQLLGTTGANEAGIGFAHINPITSLPMGLLSVADEIKAYADLSKEEKDERLKRRSAQALSGATAEDLADITNRVPRGRGRMVNRDRPDTGEGGSYATGHLGWAGVNALPLPFMAKRAKGVFSGADPFGQMHKPNPVYDPSKYGLVTNYEAREAKEKAELAAKTFAATKRQEVPGHKPVPIAVYNDPHTIIQSKSGVPNNPDYLDQFNLKPTGKEATGTNPGRFMQDLKTGDEYYVKHVGSDALAKHEILGSKLYQLMGVPTADIKLTKAANGKLAVASKAVPGKQLSAYLRDGVDPASIKQLQENVVVDAFMHNWDSVGIGLENPYGNMIIKDGVAHRIDPGGWGPYRGMGEPKTDYDKSDVINDIERMINHHVGGKVFGSVTDEDIKKGAQKVVDLPKKDIAGLIEKFGPEDPGEKQRLFNDLIKRQKDIGEHFGLKPSSAATEAKPTYGAPSSEDLKAEIDKLVAQIEKPPAMPPASKAAVAAEDAVEQAPDDWYRDKWPKDNVAKPTYGAASSEDPEAEIAKLVAQIEKTHAKPAKAVDSVVPQLPEDALAFLKKKSNMTKDEAREELMQVFGGDVETMLDWYGYKPRNLVAHTTPAAKKEAPNPVSLAGPANPKTGVTNEMLSLYGGTLAKALAEGSPTKGQVKSAVQKLMGKSNENYPYAAAENLWRLGQVNPHGAEGVFRAMEGYQQEVIAEEIKKISKIEGFSPFDDLSKSPGKYKTSHIVSQAEANAKVKDYKSAEDYTFKDLEEYYAGLDDAAGKEDAMAKGTPAMHKPLDLDIGETMTLYQQPGPLDKEWDKYLHTLKDFTKYEPDPEHASLRNIQFPNAKTPPRELGFHDRLKLYKGGSKKDPKELQNPPKGFMGEISTSLTDQSDIAYAYSKVSGGVSEYIVAPKKAMVVDYPKVFGGVIPGEHSAEYDNTVVKKILKAAQYRGADLVVIRNIYDIGGGGQTQYHVLDTSIMRNPRAEFKKSHIGKAMPFASVAGGTIFVYGNKDKGDAKEFNRGGAVSASKIDKAIRTAKKYASGGPLDLMADKNDMTNFAPHTKGLLGSSVPGRTDKLPIKVKPGSYVIPADIVSSSALGEGNTLAGSKMLDIGLAPHRSGMGHHLLKSGQSRNKSPTPKFAQHSSRVKMPRVRMPRSTFAEGGGTDWGSLKFSPTSEEGGYSRNGLPLGKHKIDYTMPTGKDSEAFASGSAAPNQYGPEKHGLSGMIGFRKKFAAGGEADGIPIIAAGGEYVLSNEDVAALGDGDATKGHDMLDKWVLQVRKHNIKILKNLPPPKRS